MTSPITTHSHDLPAMMTSPSSHTSNSTHLPLKIFISTWNMGDSIPKGDLSVLYGDIPSYTPPPTSPTSTSLPDFGATQGHPYHLIVIAAQECPTQSGVPRGIAGGLTKGMGGLREREKLKEKERARDAKERSKEVAKEQEKEGKELQVDEEASPTVGTPHHGHHAVHVKLEARGWSDILEDYFCHGIQSHRRVKTTSTNNKSESSLPPNSLNNISPSIDILVRSPNLLVPPSESRGPSPSLTGESLASTSYLGSSIASSYTPSLKNLWLERDRQRSVSPASAAAEPFNDLELLSASPPTITPTTTSNDPFPHSKTTTTNGDDTLLRQNLPTLIIPSSQAGPSTSPGTKGGPSGPYQFLVKERLLGLYVAIFVHKDAAHLVDGHDKDYVPAGLVGGRVGNKGGIGVSLNMCGHRLLFVNSHLAAHTRRMEARMANVEKIRNELHLQSFLPPTDPSNQAEDIEDRFDTVFWFGDLNFRLDVSRLHADWLINRREYKQALEFDQLRNVMHQGDLFAGYHEGPIDFPPTFKYDVWRSVKRSRSTRTRSGTVGSIAAGSRRMDRSALQGVREVEGQEEAAAETPADSDDDDEGQSSEVASIRRGSIDSSVWNSTFGGHTDVEEGEDDGEPVYTVKQPPRPIAEVAVTSAIKAKHKLLKILRGPARQQSPVPSSPASSSNGQRSRGLSRAETPVGLESEVGGLPPPPRFGGVFDTTDIDRTSAIEAVDTETMATARPAIHRQISSKLKRRLSVRRDRADSSDSSEGEQEDTREGVYDSSSKQRVPSWCDRVLWRTHIYPDILIQDTKPESTEAHEGRLGRIGAALSHVLHRRHRERASSTGYIADHTTMPGERPSSFGHERIEEKSPPSPGTRAAAVSIPPILTRNSSIRFNVTSAAMEESTTLSPSPGDITPSRNTDTSASTSTSDVTPPQAERPRSNSIGPAAIVRAKTEAPPSSPRRRSDGRRSPYRDSLHSHMTASTSLPRSRTIGTTQDAGSAMIHDDSERSFFSARRKWLRDLPSILLHQRTSTESSHEVSLGQVVDTVRKKQRGEVECVRYGTLDDAAMRRLEGRSDHRPIVFEGVVYI